MISEKTRKEKVNQLVRDIFLQVKTPKVHEEVKEDPEAFLLSLLTEIKDRLSGDAKYWMTLHHTVQAASYTSHIEKAKEELAQPA